MVPVVISPRSASEKSSVGYSTNVIIFKDVDRTRIDFFAESDAKAYKNLMQHPMRCEHKSCSGNADAIISRFRNGNDWDVEYLCAFHIAVTIITLH